MTSQLRRIVYLSTATVPLTEIELKQLLDQARRKNTADNVTGLLIYHDGCFLQVLEGAPETLDATLARIRGDDRHHSMIVVHRGEAAERVFPDWSMGYLPREEMSDEQRAAFVDIREPFGKVIRPELLDSSLVAPLVESFLSSFREFDLAL